MAGATGYTSCFNQIEDGCENISFHCGRGRVLSQGQGDPDPLSSASFNCVNWINFWLTRHQSNHLERITEKLKSFYWRLVLKFPDLSQTPLA